MKRIEAIIRPQLVEAVKSALVVLGHHGITVLDVRGHGIQKGVSEQWRGEKYVVDLLPKSMVVAVVHDHQVQDCIDVISKAARTEHMGDGKIFITPVEQVIRIRTGESGSSAL
jgi:nitrogen regulatory protein P-II 1